jgi:putative peptide zinc metalloprotease protein
MFTLLPVGRASVIPSFYTPLFLPPVILAVLAGFVAMDVWLWGVHGIGQGLRDTLYQPFNVLLLLGMVILSAGFHEFGHAAACTYGGARPGKIGGGLYLVWPAFYTDVTDAYRLNRRGRLRTDLAGVYFNLIFALATLGLYAVTGYEPLLVLIPIQHLEILHQLLPFLRMDGYYILADLTGVPDLFNRIGPILRSAVPGREKDAKVSELKPWVRVVVTGWVLVIAPLLVYLFTMTVISAPRVVATAWDSAGAQLATLTKSFAGGDAIAVIAALVQLIVLVLPVAGLVYSIVRITNKAVGAGWHWSAGSPPKRALVVVLTALAAGLAAFTWWPNGEYRPIQKGERFVVQDSVRSIGAIGTGRRGLTADRARALEGAPSAGAQRGATADDGLVEPAAATEEPATSTTTTEQTSPSTTSTTLRATTTTARPSTATSAPSLSSVSSTTTTTTTEPATTTTTTETTDTTAP